MDLATKCEKTEFLSFEFLAWLAARAELDMGVLTDEKDPLMEMWFEKKLVLSERDSPHEQTVIRSDEPVSSFETKTSLRLGKWIREANISLVHDKMEWHFQVSAPELKLKGIKIKTGADFKKGEDGAVIDRVAGLEDLLHLWERFYEHFLRLRLDPDAWSAEVARIGQWIVE
jgi:hypothetical protein